MRRFGELEAVIMDRLWAWGRPVLVREVVDDQHDDRPLAYTTVMTVMEHLYRKGWLRRERDGRACAARFASISKLRATRNSQGRMGRSSALSWGR